MSSCSRCLEEAHGLVVFVHGSGSSRFSPRNRYVAESLNEAGFATLLFDLLTAREDEIDARTEGMVLAATSAAAAPVLAPK